MKPKRTSRHSARRHHAMHGGRTPSPISSSSSSCSSSSDHRSRSSSIEADDNVDYEPDEKDDVKMAGNDDIDYKGSTHGGHNDSRLVLLGLSSRQ